MPDVPEQYVHRIGRTARAGADGIAIAFCSPDERINLRDIERTRATSCRSPRFPDGFNAAVQAVKALKLAASARDERGGGGRRDAGQAAIAVRRAARVAIQPEIAVKASGAREGQPQRHPQRPARTPLTVPKAAPSARWPRRGGEGCAAGYPVAGGHRGPASGRRANPFEALSKGRMLAWPDLHARVRASRPPRSTGTIA